MAHVEPLTLKDRLAKVRQLVPPSSRWVHHKKPDEPYEVVEVGFLEKDETPVVMYKTLDGFLVWVRPLEEFLSKVEREGIAGPRFRKLA